MEPRIETFPEKKLVGRRLKMSFAQDRTFELWRSFMPGCTSIRHKITSDLFSMQVYDQLPDFINFNPEITFDKWALIEVSEFEEIPGDMESFIFPGGLYAVFIHKGPASSSYKTFQYIFNTWLPNSDFELDHRAHLAIMGDKYKQEAPDSEEEIWIPVKAK